MLELVDYLTYLLIIFNCWSLKCRDIYQLWSEIILISLSRDIRVIPLFLSCLCLVERYSRHIKRESLSLSIMWWIYSFIHPLFFLPNINILVKWVKRHKSKMNIKFELFLNLIISYPIGNIIETIKFNSLSKSFFVKTCRYNCTISN